MANKDVILGDEENNTLYPYTTADQTDYDGEYSVGQKLRQFEEIIERYE